MFLLLSFIQLSHTLSSALSYSQILVVIMFNIQAKIDENQGRRAMNDFDKAGIIETSQVQRLLDWSPSFDPDGEGVGIVETYGNLADAFNQGHSHNDLTMVMSGWGQDTLDPTALHSLFYSSIAGPALSPISDQSNGSVPQQQMDLFDAVVHEVQALDDLTDALALQDIRAGWIGTAVGDGHDNTSEIGSKYLIRGITAADNIFAQDRTDEILRWQSAGVYDPLTAVSDQTPSNSPRSRSSAQVCHLCNTKLSVRKSLVSHLKYVHGPPSFPCSLCSKICTRGDNLTRHMKREHGLVRDLVECRICRKRVSKRGLAVHHQKNKKCQAVRAAKRRSRLDTLDLHAPGIEEDPLIVVLQMLTLLRRSSMGPSAHRVYAPMAVKKVQWLGLQDRALKLIRQQLSIQAALWSISLIIAVTLMGTIENVCTFGTDRAAKYHLDEAERARERWLQVMCVCKSDCECFLNGTISPSTWDLWDRVLVQYLRPICNSIFRCEMLLLGPMWMEYE